MFARVLNPRQCRVVALPARTSASARNGISSATSSICRPRAKSSCSTAAGTTAPASSRSWAFARPSRRRTFLKAAPEFERHLVDDGILLFKYWLCCDQEVQEDRFENRLHNPMKRWKLSPIDIEARKQYEDYTEARETMLAATHTDFAPWTLVDFNDQPVGRLTLLRDFLDRVPDTELPLADIPWPPLEHSRRRSAMACSSRSPTIRSHRTRRILRSRATSE